MKKKKVINYTLVEIVYTRPAEVFTDWLTNKELAGLKRSIRYKKDRVSSKKLSTFSITLKF